MSDDVEFGFTEEEIAEWERNPIDPLEARVSAVSSTGDVPVPDPLA